MGLLLKVRVLVRAIFEEQGPCFFWCLLLPGSDDSHLCGHGPCACVCAVCTCMAWGCPVACLWACQRSHDDGGPAVFVTAILTNEDGHVCGW